MTTRSKFVCTYVGGLFTGIIITFLFFFFAALQTSEDVINDKIEMFDKPQREIKVKTFEIIQVLPNGNALAVSRDISRCRDSNFGLVVLFLAKQDFSYYDNQSIEVPKNKCVMQVGTFKYESRDKIYKTVPIVEIVDI